MSNAKPQKPRLRLIVGKTPSFESVRVFVPKIGYDEKLDCFYVDSMEYAVKTLPANFHTHELMDVDSTNADSLLTFQQSWGLVTSALRMPLRKNTLGVSRHIIASPLCDQDGNRLSQEDELMEAANILNSLNERHASFKRLGFSTSPIVVQPFYPFAPRREVEGTVTYLQDAVKKLVEAVMEGYDDWGNIDYVNLRTLVDDIAEYISPYYPPVEVLPQDQRFDGFGKSSTETQPPIIPLSIATLAQLVGYLTSSTGYRVCPHCHKYFMFKRHRAPGNYMRNRRSEYCSDSCQNAAKQKRYQIRKEA